MDNRQWLNFRIYIIFISVQAIGIYINLNKMYLKIISFIYKQPNMHISQKKKKCTDLQENTEWEV